MRKLHIPTADIDEVAGRLAEFESRIDAALAPIAADLQTLLTELQGQSFGSRAANLQFVRRLSILLNRLDKRVRCQKEGCHAPATLRVAGGKQTKEGSFQFRHYSDGRLQHHSGINRLPVLDVVDAPADQRRVGKR